MREWDQPLTDARLCGAFDGRLNAASPNWGWWKSELGMTRDDMKGKGKALRDAFTLQCRPVADTESKTEVKGERGAVDGVAVDADAAAPAATPAPPSLSLMRDEMAAEVELAALARKYTLNFEQRQVLYLIGRQFFRTKAGEDEETLKPLRLFVEGPGGTGKTHVVRAVKELFAAHGRQRWLEAAAFMGAAAIVIGGSTLHKLLRIPVNRAFKTLDGRKLEQFRAELGALRFLVIDEVSTLGLKLLDKINARLQLAKGNNRTFGGVNVIFMGDFLQFQPVGDTPLYKKPDIEHIEPGSSINQANAHFAWTGDAESNQGLTHCIQLHRQKRVSDKKLGAFLARMRKGECTLADHHWINDRIVTVGCFRGEQWDKCTTIVRLNEERAAFNNEYISQLSAQARDSVAWVMAEDRLVGAEGNEGKERKGRKAKEAKKRKGPGAALPLVTESEFTAKVRKHLRSVNDAKTHGQPGWLPLVPGAPLMLTSNLSTKLGLCNGTIGYFAGALCQGETVAKALRRGAAVNSVMHQHLGRQSEVKRAVLSEMPVCIYLRVPVPLHTPFPGLPPDVVPTYPRTAQFDVMLAVPSNGAR